MNYLEDMTGYSKSRNSVDDILFELLKDMPENLSLHQQLGEDFLHRLVRQQPNATLHRYSQLIQQRRGISISPQAIGKLLTRIGLSGHVRRQFAAATAKPLAA